MEILKKRRMSKKEVRAYRDFAREHNNKLAVGMIVSITISVIFGIGFIYVMSLKALPIFILSLASAGVFLFLLNKVLPAKQPAYSLRGTLKEKRKLKESGASYFLVEHDGKTVMAKTSLQTYDDSINGDSVVIFKYKEVMYGFVVF